MLLKVDLPEGSYLADVGFGACVLDAPLRLEAGAEQATAMGVFRLSEAEGVFMLSARQPAGWRAMYAFNLEPQIPSDYELGNWFTATSPLAPFPNVLIVERVSRDKRYKLINRRFAIEAREGQIVAEQTIATADELGRILDQTFNLAPPAH